MNELLAPAGDYEALIAAIYNGADAVYLGLNIFSARAYAKNFSIEELKKAVIFAHLRNVKIYLTLNTMVYSDELKEIYDVILQAYTFGVDGIIISDLALLDYIKENFKDTEIHASTQMGIDNINGINVMAKLGVARVVIAREVNYKHILELKRKSSLPIEVFIHGALCVSYSGACLMSGLIGDRSANRGRCVGSCRKEYRLHTNNKDIGSSYLLNMKNLNTTDHINELKDFDSLKIEGRMKTPEYVASAVSTYRNLLNGNNTNNLLDNTFNRIYTKGYVFNEKPVDIVDYKINSQQGIIIGKVISKNNKYYKIKLSDCLYQGDQIIIDSKNSINMTAIKIYDEKLNLISEANKFVYLLLPSEAKKGDLVYKTRNKKFVEEMKKTYYTETNKLLVDFTISGAFNKPLEAIIYYEDFIIKSFSDDLLEKSLKSPLTKDILKKQFGKLNDTPYTLNEINTNIDDNIFMTIKNINALRRKSIDALNNARLKQRTPIIPKNTTIPISFAKTSPAISVYATTNEQYMIAKSLGIKIIYYDNVIKRHNAKTIINNKDVLLSGYNGIYENNNYITDHQFNVVNEKSINALHRLGAKRITISHEINKNQIKTMVDNYISTNNGYPSLEMIIYGRQELMYTKYCPLKKYNLCNVCKSEQYFINDTYASFPIKTYPDCTTSIFNSKILNLTGEKDFLSKYINVFRFHFTIESANETKKILSKAIKNESVIFDSTIHTRGQYKRKVL